MRSRPFPEIAIENPSKPLIQDIIHKTAFPRAGHAADAGKNPLRDPDVDLFEVIVRRALNTDPSVRFSRFLSPDHPGLFAAQIGSGQAIGFRDVFKGAAGDDFSSESARCGPHFDYCVRSHHRIPVVFHDNDAVPQIPNGLQRPDESRRVSRMKPDRGFVKHIQDAAEFRADLRGKTDPLTLPPAQRIGAPME